jgi:hypothetical protein
MIRLRSPSPENSKSGADEYIKVSSLIEGSSIDRRKEREERRLSFKRRKMFSSSLYAGEERRENKLEDRRKKTDRRDGDCEAIKSVDELKLNSSSINTLIEEQKMTMKRLDKLLSLKKSEDFSHIEDKVKDVYIDIQSLMVKEEYLLCLYLETNKEKLTEVHIERLLSIIHTDISKLSDGVVQLVEKYRLAQVNQKNVGFVQLDMSIILNKFSACLEKKEALLYPIYTM